MEDAEEEVAARGNASTDAVDDEEDTKAKVEKMRLGTVRDVRSVAGLMKTLQPVLEVSHPLDPKAILIHILKQF
jgi:U4/U6 small nuclear ribonucleoprotein PRP31